jgi:methionyl-tRNA formyltransferase
MKLTKDMRIVFMGTPDFAVASLQALLQAGFNVVSVITAPDKPGGRGMQMQQSAVKQFAVANGLPVLQPEKLKNPAFLQQLQALAADIQVVVAFRMLPEVVWNMPPHGSINVHGSLLPLYRGAAPINWAVINGETQTGVTTFKLQHQIDTGNILLQQSLPIGPNETAGEVHDRMKAVGAALLVATLNALVTGNLQEQPQQIWTADNKTIPHAPKIFTETCLINFNQPALPIHNHIRGLSPFPGAFTHLQNKLFKIYRSAIVPNTTATHEPGSWQTDGKTFLQFATSDGYIQALEVQAEGKKRMPISMFLQGFRM